MYVKEINIFYFILKLRSVFIFLWIFLVSCSSLPLFNSSDKSSPPYHNKKVSPHRRPAANTLSFGALPEKPTVCSISLNLASERDIFKKHLGSDFNFVELFDQHNPHWLSRFCEKRIQCDILIISSHFSGGVFFGKLGKFTLNDLDHKFCTGSCQGVIKTPREVFLFGSRTVHENQPDIQSIDSYAKILLAEHGDLFSTMDMARGGAILRHLYLKPSMKTRMMRLFRYSRIYGFYDLAPTTAHLSGNLESYFKSLPHKDYKLHLSQFPINDNPYWTEAMKEGLSTRSFNGSFLSGGPLLMCTRSSDIITD